MNARHVISRLGLLFIVLSGVMILVAAIFFILELLQQREAGREAHVALLISGLIGVGLGLVCWVLNRKVKSYIGRREALLLVALSWLIGAALAALPFFLWAKTSEAPASIQFAQFIDCYFEAMSGLTTTGATILSDIEPIPRSLLFWRAITHWLGGLGIVVLFVAVLPSLGVGGKKLFQVEATGLSPGGLQPQIKETARILAGIYIGLTIIEILALKIAGMTFYDAICHTFATLSSGGFSTKNASLGYYADKPAIDLIVILFMTLAGVNFALYHQLIKRKFRRVFQDTELRFYFFLILAGVLLVHFALRQDGAPLILTTGETVEASPAESLIQSFFTSVALKTGTGFCTTDYNPWPFLTHAVIIFFMFTGGCSGSTTGGIKVIRIWIMLKIMVAEIEHAFRPNVIRPVKVGGNTIDPETKLGVIVFILGIIVLFGLGSIAIMLLEGANPSSVCDYTTAASATVSTLCTVGPGLGGVGALENYGWFSGESKAVMCVLMMLGRLEIFAIIVLFTPRFWRGS
jgi:trk system potassium uptake protein TrkH